jgi:hypothetical protein
MKSEKWATAATLTRKAKQVAAVAYFSFFIVSFSFPQFPHQPIRHQFIFLRESPVPGFLEQLEFFGCSNGIVDCPHGSWRASFVVETH